MIIEALKAFLIGIVEGITEWLPISSTGHMILVDEFVHLDVSDDFLNMFLVVIQLGAILAVVILYFNKLNPFASSKTQAQRKRTWRLWGMVIIGTIPAAIVGLLLDDWVNDHFYNKVTVSVMLIVYGIAFILIERRNRRLLTAQGARTGGGFAAPSQSVRGKHARVEERVGDDFEAMPANQGEGLFRVNDVEDLDWKTALKIGCFQALAVIPGTSRSGAIIVGGLLCKCSRPAATEFAFFLAIPVMLGWGILKVIKFVAAGLVMTATEVMVLVVGVVTAFAMSIVAIKFLIGYVQKNDFTAFGWYRIAVGLVVL
ncbi:MAG: undecaprenyl-diphosphate phosphatase, partial [Eggerthellaceae bacterium]|nr:undecaprenyl-diphosphate phosphatase [Eggerthellaceae bacterium]